MNFFSVGLVWVMTVFIEILANGLYSTPGELPYKDIITRPDFKPRPEKVPNMTIDQFIAAAYGGLQEYMSQNFFDLEGGITTELDLVLTKEQFQSMYMKNRTKGTRHKRKATRPLVYRWTNKVIPFEFAVSDFTADEVYYIHKAMETWQNTTCLTFRPYTTSDRNRIRFQNGYGCNSQLGMVKGVQAINLEKPGCRYTGLYLHEIGHAIGLVHEHQLPDRDNYIYVIYDNVASDMRIWFNKYTSDDVNQYGVPYEYSSVMHYGVTAFSKDGTSQTIRAKDRKREKEIGFVYLKGLSFSDIKVVNLMYDCNKHCTADPSCKEPAYLDKNCKCVHPPETGGDNGSGSEGDCYNIWNDDECQNWSNKGECEANPLWMKENCKKSCKTCDSTEVKPDPNGCKNNWGDAKCNQWAADGECEANPIWMKENCNNACKYCKDSGTGTGTDTTTSLCKDMHMSCQSWAKSGYCESNWYTKENCKKSCNTCPPTVEESGSSISAAAVAFPSFITMLIAVCLI